MKGYHGNDTGGGSNVSRKATGEMRAIRSLGAGKVDRAPKSSPNTDKGGNASGGTFKTGARGSHG